MVLGITSSLNELLNNYRRRRYVGVPEAEIDDVDAGATRFKRLLGHLSEDVRGQVVDSSEIHPVSVGLREHLGKDRIDDSGRLELSRAAFCAAGRG